MKKHLTGMLILIMTIHSYGQQGTWVRYMGLTDYNYPSNVFEKNNKDIVIVATTGNDKTNSNITFIVCDTNGYIIDHKIDYSENIEYVNNAILSIDSSFIITGVTNNTNPLDYNIIVSKYSKTFNKLWTLNIGSSEKWDQGNSILEVSDGLIIGGYVSDTLTNNKNIYLGKIDLNGTKIWEKTYDFGFEEAINSLSVDITENIIGCGYISSLTDSTSTLLVKFNSIGDTLWTRKSSYNHFNIAKSVTTSNLDIYLTGQSKSINNDTTSCFVEKFDENGNKIWNQNYYNFSGSNILYTTEDELVIFGDYYQEFGDIECLFLKLNNGGWFISSNTGGGIDTQLGKDIKRLKSKNGYIAVGTDYHGYVGIHDIELFKTGDNLYYDFNNLDTVLTAKTMVSPNYITYIYPNPNQGTLLYFNNPTHQEISNFEIFNIYGEIILKKEKTKENYLNIELNPGIYFISFFINNTVITQKFTVSK